MTITRILGGGLLVVAIYAAISVEAVCGGRTLLPHAPAVALILVAWAVPATHVVIVAAGIGLGCDAIGQQAFGPGLIAAVVAAIVGSNLRAQWQLETPVAAVLFGVGVGAMLIAGPDLARQLCHESDLEVGSLQLDVARAMSSAMAATGLILAARVAGSAQRLANAVVTR
jgi:hypothetical protein